MPERQIHIAVPTGKVPERVDMYLTHHIENATRSKIQMAIRSGAVLVDGKPVKPSHKVVGGEKIVVTIPKAPPPEVKAENIPLDVIFEDDFLVVVNKPAGMVTHPAFGHYTGTLVNALLYHCGRKLSGLNHVIRPGIVHRLDKDTSGLLVVAKDDHTHAALARQFSSRTIDREYWAIVWGRFEGKLQRQGLIEASLGRSKSDRKKIAVRIEGKQAATRYEVLEEFPYLSLMRLRLLTGRTHQIRVHLHHIGHPVFGDPTYGGRRIAWGGTEKKKKDDVQTMLRIMSRQALHAKTVGFVHPVTRQMMKFDSDLPPDMISILQMLRQAEKQQVTD